jgi:hypothetical protein
LSGSDELFVYLKESFFNYALCLDWNEFYDNALGIIGHDSGEIVKGIKGQTGYLYEVWTQDNSFELFMQKLSVAEGINFDPETLMNWLAKNYNTEHADKEIGKLLETHGIRVSWFFD